MKIESSPITARLRVLANKIVDPHWARLDLACEVDRVVDDLIEIERQRRHGWNPYEFVILGFMSGTLAALMVDWYLEIILRWILS